MTSRSKKYNYNISASGNFVTNNLNLGVSNMFSGSFSASNNVSSPTNVTGLSFNNSTTRYFNCQLTVSIAKTSGGNLYELFTLEANQSETGWELYETTISDITGVQFSITSTGQVQYTSSNVSNFISSTFRYTVTQITTTGTYSNLTTGTQGTYVLNSIQLTNTVGSIIGTDPGALYVMGGSTFDKMISIRTTDNAVGFGTGGGLSVYGGAAISKNLLVNGNIGVGTVNPVNNLDITGTARITTSVTTGAVYATNSTVSNAVFTNNTIANSIITTLIVSGNSTFAGPVLQIPTGDIATRPVANLGYIRYNTETSQFEGYGPGNAWGSLGGVVDIAQTTKVLASANPSVTDGNLYFYTVGTERVRINSAGNIGIGTTAPSNTLDVTGTIRASTSVTTGAIYATNTTVTNAVATNVSTGTLNASTDISTVTLNASTGLTSASAQITNANVTTLTAATLLNTNQNSTNVSAATLNLSTGVTAASAQITNAVSTNISVGTILATTYTGGSISLSGSVTAITGTIGTFAATTSSAETAVATTYTGGSMSLSGDLVIGGTLTTVNITTTNISETNVSAGTVSATNIGVTTQTVGTSRITTSLLALGNSNTIGNIFTTGGNVGIGTSSPQTDFHINGGVGGGLQLGPANTNGFHFLATAGGLNGYSGTWGGGLTRFCVGSTGNFGINTLGPRNSLEITQLSSTTGVMLYSGLNDGGVNSIVFNHSNHGSLYQKVAIQTQALGGGLAARAHLALCVNTANDNTNVTMSDHKLFIHGSSGNIGVGTTNPSLAFHVKASNLGDTMILENSSATGYATMQFKTPSQTFFIGLGGASEAQNTYRDKLYILNTSSNGIVLDTNGYVGIGTKSPSELFQVNTGSTVLMQLNTAGRLSVLDDVIAFASFSDSRLKSDIQTVSQSDAVDVVNALRPVTFKWKDTISNVGKRGVLDIGFIAQEVEAITPYAVDEFTDMADKVEYKRIKHERLLPYLVASIQHLTKLVNEKCKCCCKCDETL